MKNSFVDNVTGRHGEVLRSSAIFYFVRSPKVRTTISLLNYWPIKRNIKVYVLASLRRMDGGLVRRDRISFDKGMVVNYSPDFEEASFEGSVEVEVFSVENLVIPYAAVMAVYESAAGVSMVHSYARAYSRHEVEEGRTISSGSEGCWTLRDNEQFRSFAVLHNGGSALEEQAATLELLNSDGECRRVPLTLPALKPYATVKLFPEAHVPDLVSFLAGKPGAASLVYKLGDGFVRMLVGNEARDFSDMQVTHSNFDYRSQNTDYVPGNSKAYMVVPALLGKKKVVVYPHSANGRYKVSSRAGWNTEFRSGEMTWFDLPESTDTLEFERLDGELPSRLVTAIVLQKEQRALPNECSLGVLHHLQPRKRMWWGICGGARDLDSRIVIHDLSEIYGGIPSDQRLILTVYSATQTTPLSANLAASDLAALERGVRFSDIFPDLPEFLGSNFGYYVLFHEYGGLTAYSTFENARGSICLEHGF